MGWNGSDLGKVRGETEGRQRLDRVSADRPMSSPSPLIRRGILAGLAVVIGGGIAAWLVFRSEGTIQPKERMAPRPAQIAEKTPSISAHAPVTNVAAQTVRAKPAVTGNVTAVKQTVQMRTLEDGTQVPVSKPRFTNGIERALSTLCNPGGMAIPLASALRRFSEAEILRILNTPMEYDKNDDKDLMARKMEMQRIKDEIRDYLNEGHTVKEAIAEADRRIRRDGSYLMMMRRTMHEALATGDGEVVRAYVKSANQKLESRGMRPFEVPQRYRLAEEPHEDGKTE